jgi:hypothetical protein
MIAILAQFALGWGAFATKYGIPSAGIVAEADSIEQVFFRTAHMMVGVLIMTASTLMIARIERVEYLRKQYALLNSSTGYIAESQQAPAHNIVGNQSIQTV